MLVDQAPERTRGAVRVSFLGEEAWVDLAPALCAARARVPVVVAFPRRLGDGTHTIDVPAVISPPARPSRRWVEATMREVTALLEVQVRRYPDQWLWMHRRWKDAPGATLGARAFGGLASPSS
jgi:KDO2-lipid IV(A) lauroyltransferase